MGGTEGGEGQAQEETLMVVRKNQSLICKAEVRRRIMVSVLERGLDVKQVHPEVFADAEQAVMDQVNATLGWYGNYGKHRPRLRKYGHRYK